MNEVTPPAIPPLVFWLVLLAGALICTWIDDLIGFPRTTFWRSVIHTVFMLFWGYAMFIAWFSIKFVF